MIREENLHKLYALVSQNETLNYKTLYSCGFKAMDIIELVLKKYLRVKGFDSFEFENPSKLYEYSFSLLAKGRIQEAKNGFKTCLKIDANFYPAALQLFIKSLETSEYDWALSYFRIMTKNKNLSLDEKNFFLYLLSFLANLSQEEKDCLKELHTGDILIADKENNEINEVRKLSFYQKFTSAKRKLNELFPIGDDYPAEIKALKILLNKNIKLQKENYALLSEMACKEDYHSIIVFISRLKEKQASNSYLNIILYLAKTMENILKNGLIPDVKVKKTKSFKRAVYGNNFALAYKIKRNKEGHSNHDAVYFLLSKLIMLTNKNKTNIPFDDSLKIPELVIAAEENGIVILPQMAKEIRRAITLDLQSYPNISVFLIGLSGDERLVIKAGGADEKKIDVSELVKLSKETYSLGNYEECLMANMELLKHCRFNLETYAKLGICYYKLGNYALAIDYLTIPTEIAKAQNLSSAYDYSNLINHLKCLLENPDNIKGGRK